MGVDSKIQLNWKKNPFGSNIFESKLWRQKSAKITLKIPSLTTGKEKRRIKPTLPGLQDTAINYLKGIVNNIYHLYCYYYQITNHQKNRNIVGPLHKHKIIFGKAFKNETTFSVVILRLVYIYIYIHIYILQKCVMGNGKFVLTNLWQP